MSISGKKLDASTVDEDDPDPVPDCASARAVKDKVIFNRSILPYIHSCIFPQSRPNSGNKRSTVSGTVMLSFASGTGFHTKSFSFFYGFEAAGR